MEVVPVVVGALGAVSKRFIWIYGLTSWGLQLIRVSCRKRLFGNSKDFKEGIGKLKE